jgi:hypothetical protein
MCRKPGIASAKKQRFFMSLKCVIAALSKAASGQSPRHRPADAVPQFFADLRS